MMQFAYLILIPFIHPHTHTHKVIPRYNVRGRNRSSSAKFTNTSSLLPSATVAVRSNSFRVNRNTGRGAGNVTPDFCQHIKYCCLHQNLTTAAVVTNTRIDSENVDRVNRNEKELFSGENRTSKGAAASAFKIVDEMNANGSGFSNFSDDEKSMKLTRKFSVDASINLNPSSIHNKSLQHSYESFDTRKCNCGKSFSLISILFNPFSPTPSSPPFLC